MSRAATPLMRTAVPDLHVDAEHLTAIEDDVASAYTITGTDQGPLMGHEPAGRTINVRGAQVGRFADGKLVERWGRSDQLSVFTQLGIVDL